MDKVAVITGSNKGIGFEVAREMAGLGYKVAIACRNEEQGKQRAKEIPNASFIKLDISSRESIQTAVKEIIQKFGRIDSLVNNAAILLDKGGSKESDIFLKTFETNILGAFYMIEEVLPLMKKQNYGRIVNVSSGMGQLSEMKTDYPAYRLSKTALNGVTRMFDSDVSGQNILINSVCPGWVKTEMGGSNAPRSLDEGARGIVWAATLPDNGPTGEFFRDQKKISW